MSPFFTIFFQESVPKSRVGVDLDVFKAANQFSSKKSTWAWLCLLLFLETGFAVNVALSRLNLWIQRHQQGAASGSP